MSDTGFTVQPVEPAEHERSVWIDIAAGVILGAAALLTAFSAYQGNMKGGDAQVAYTESTQQLSDANFFYSRANSELAFDQQLFLEFVGYRTADNTVAENYVRESLMSDTLREAVTWWEDTVDAVTPFDDLEGNPYVNETLDSANELQASSEESFAAASELDDQSDEFELATVLLAVTLFFGGIATLFKPKRLTFAMLIVAAFTLATGSVVTLGAM